jgi:hypothetical protein
MSDTNPNRRPFLVTMHGSQIVSEINKQADRLERQAASRREREQLVSKLHGDSAHAVGGLFDDRKPSEILAERAERLRNLSTFIDTGKQFDLNFGELAGLGMIDMGFASGFAGIASGIC